MSSIREEYTYHGDIRIDVQEIFFDSRYRRYYRLPVFASPRLQPSPRPVIQSITSSRPARSPASAILSPFPDILVLSASQELSL